MADITYISTGFDTERPYGPRAESEGAGEEIKLNTEYHVKLKGVLDRLSVPRTVYLLGDYLERCRLDFSDKALRELYTFSPFSEVQSHTHSHGLIRTVKERPDTHVMNAVEFRDDLERATRIIQETLHVKPTGVRLGYGYDRDLGDRPDVLEVLRKAGMRFVCSFGRDGDSVETPLNEERQPHTYRGQGFPGIVELPIIGAQDVIFTRDKARQLLGRDPTRGKDVVEHYLSLVRKAKEMPLPVVSISLAMHPWAMREYDPEVELYSEFISRAMEMNRARTKVEVLTQSDLAYRIREADARKTRW